MAEHSVDKSEGSFQGKHASVLKLRNGFKTVLPYFFPKKSVSLQEPHFMEEVKTHQIWYLQLKQDCLLLQPYVLETSWKQHLQYNVDGEHE